jgi:hypothetical protein
MSFKIRPPFGSPASRNYSRSVVTNREWHNIAANTNMERVDIDPTETEPRTQALMPKWRYGTSDQLGWLEGWVNMQAPAEETAVDAARAVLQGELDELNAKTNPDDDDTKRIAELERDLTSLSTYRYWVQASNTFGDGRVSLYRSCSAPNVPYRLRSSWSLEADRPFTIFLHRCKPHEAQKDSRVRFRFGRWALVFSQEREVELVRYKDGKLWEVPEEDAEDTNPLANGRWVEYQGTNFDVTDRAEEAIEALRDNGRLTAADREQIADWQQELRDAKASLKTNEKQWAASGNQAQIDSTNATIANLKRQIEELRETKRGLSPEIETKIKQLEDALYAEKTTVQWAHMAESTLNVDLAVTIVPQPRGFMVLHNSVGKDYFVCEDASVTETGLDGTMIGATRVQVDGNGGALWFSVGYIIPEQYAMIKSERCSFDGMTVAGEGTLHWDATVSPGTTIYGSVTKIGKTSYQWQLTMTSASGYLPFLYRLYFDLLATPRTAEGEVFDSNQAPELTWDVGFSRERENRGRAATLKLTIPEVQSSRFSWVETLQKKQVEVYENGTQVFAGECGDATVDWVGPHRRYEVRSYDRWAIMVEDRMWCDIIGDGRPLWEYVDKIARGVGLSSSELVIARNEVTERELPRAVPGEEPALQPEWGGSRGDWLARLVADFAYFHDLWFDGRGRLHLEPLGATNLPLRLRIAHASPTDRDVVWNVRETRSKANLRNHLLVLGRKVRGRQLSSLWVDPDSWKDDTCDRFLGRVVAEQPYSNEALVTQELCDLCCRWRAYNVSQLDRTLTCNTHYRQDVNVGDRFHLEGLVVELVSAGADDRVSEQMELTLRVIR